MQISIDPEKKLKVLYEKNLFNDSYYSKEFLILDKKPEIGDYINGIHYISPQIVGIKEFEPHTDDSHSVSNFDLFIISVKYKYQTRSLEDEEDTLFVASHKSMRPVDRKRLEKHINELISVFKEKDNNSKDFKNKIKNFSEKLYHNYNTVRNSASPKEFYLIELSYKCLLDELDITSKNLKKASNNNLDKLNEFDLYVVDELNLEQ